MAVKSKHRDQALEAWAPITDEDANDDDDDDGDDDDDDDDDDVWQWNPNIEIGH